MGRRKRSSPFVSGYCAYNPHQHPCKGQFQNGSAAPNPITLCSCECHGDYEARLQSLGIVVDLTIDEDDEELDDVA